MKSLLRVIGFIRPYWKTACATFIAAMLVTLLDLVPPWLIKVVIDDVIRAENLVILGWVVGALVLTYLGRNLLNLGRIRFNNRLEQRVIYDMREAVYRALQNLSLGYFDQRATGEVMSRINNDVNSLERIFIDGVEAILMAVLMVLGVSVVLFHLSWKLALLALLPIPFLSLGALVFTRRVHRLYHRIRQSLAGLNALLQDNVSGIREIVAYNRQGYELARFNERSRDYCQTQLKVARLWSLYSPGMLLLGSIGTVLVLGFGAGQVVRGEISIGELVAFISYLGLFYTPINQIHSVNHMLQHALASSERVFEIIDAKPQVREDPNAVAYTPRSVAGKAAGEMEFEHVFFGYRPGAMVLKDIHFKVHPGEKIALVGPSGAGKSTLIKLLMRFYDPESGSIRLDGVDLRRLKLSFLRDQIALVQQEPFLFNGTVLENIQYGDLNADFDRVEAAARAARAHDFIMDLPEGYRTWIGERGVKLSVGQKQRIAIARALLKDPPVIVLDEATSNIDSETEVRIQEALETAIRDRTTIIIAHRLSTLRLVDRILVIQNGRLIEAGTHRELLQMKGLYTTLYEAQFQI